MLRCEGLHLGGRSPATEPRDYFLGSSYKFLRKKAGDSDSRRFAVVQQIALYHHARRVQAN
ncbi:MAG: hypothetical protein IPK59_15190 [Rhodospirillaceae bacterium]|nr:hypothetical protein [Rhodospirillaceae bacterium]